MKKKLAIVGLTSVLAVGAVAAPAAAKDSGWGCGGACRVSTR